MAEHDIGEEEIMLYDPSLLNDMITQLHELNGYRTPNIGFFV